MIRGVVLGLGPLEQPVLVLGHRRVCASSGLATQPLQLDVNLGQPVLELLLQLLDADLVLLDGAAHAIQLGLHALHLGAHIRAVPGEQGRGLLQHLLQLDPLILGLAVGLVELLAQLVNILAQGLAVFLAGPAAPRQ